MVEPNSRVPWLRKPQPRNARQYREGGLHRLLEIGKSSGRKPSISEEVQEKLNQELSNPEGFDSYKEIQQWLYSVHAD